MNVYYNDNDKGSVAWLKSLIAAGLIPAGDVDDRHIQEVQPDDLRDYDQCHFFAGIGGWAEALRFAGQASRRSLWTGSCPCQPFSAAGKGKAQKDSRHLWPDFFRLIAQCRPDVVFGEQVEGAIRHGWLDGIQADLEREGYAVGHCVLGAHSVGAPHIRQRLYWVADADGRITGDGDVQRGGQFGLQPEGREPRLLAEPESQQPHGGGSPRRGRSELADGGSVGLEHAKSDGRGWSNYELVHCRDGKARRVAPGVPLLAHGIPGRVAQLRGLGNAIVPQVAAAFIEAFYEARGVK